jgi:hypothetical protein
LKTIAEAASEHVERLAVHIGSRPIGSTANPAAADYISDVFRRSGLALQTQEILCPDWATEDTSLDLNGESLEASANTFSPARHISTEWFGGETPAETIRLVVDFIEVLDEKDLSWSRPEKQS